MNEHMNEPMRGPFVTDNIAEHDALMPNGERIEEVAAVMSQDLRANGGVVGSAALAREVERIMADAVNVGDDVFECQQSYGHPGPVRHEVVRARRFEGTGKYVVYYPREE